MPLPADTGCQMWKELLTASMKHYVISGNSLLDECMHQELGKGFTNGLKASRRIKRHFRDKK
jgi:hypothetical protein